MSLLKELFEMMDGDETYSTSDINHQDDINDGDTVKTADRYGAEVGEVVSKSPSGEFIVVKMKDGRSKSFHFSDLKRVETE